MRLRAVLIQHAMIKRILWHPTNHNLLLIQTFQPEAILYLWDASLNEPRILFFPTLRLTSKPEAQWVPGQEQNTSIIVYGNAHGCALAWPDGKDMPAELATTHEDVDARSEISEPASEEDSLYAILSGKKSPLNAEDTQNAEETQDPGQENLDTVTNIPMEDTFHFRKGVGVH